MKFSIKDKYSNKEIFAAEANSFREVVELAIKQGKSLSHANLSFSDLSLTDLSNADLGCALLVGTNLMGANLENTNLDGAELKNVLLSGANFKKGNYMKNIVALSALAIGLNACSGTIDKTATTSASSASLAVTGTLVSSDSKTPIANAKVYVKGSSDSVTTDANGNFSVAVTSGSAISADTIGDSTITLIAGDSEYAVATDITLASNANTDAGQIEAAQAASISISVTTQGAQDQSGTSVSIQDSQLSTTTDASGNATLTGVPAGTWTVEIAATGHATEDVEVTVVAGEAHTMDTITIASDTSSDGGSITAPRFDEDEVALEIMGVDPNDPHGETHGGFSDRFYVGDTDQSMWVKIYYAGYQGGEGSDHGGIIPDADLITYYRYCWDCTDVTTETWHTVTRIAFPATACMGAATNPTDYMPISVPSTTGDHTILVQVKNVDGSSNVHSQTMTGMAGKYTSCN